MGKDRPSWEMPRREPTLKTGIHQALQGHIPDSTTLDSVTGVRGSSVLGIGQVWSIALESVTIFLVSTSNAHQFCLEIARLASDHKSENVVALDMRGISSVTDFVVIATGTSERQLRAVADHIIEYGKKVGEKPMGVSGYDASTWILVDYFDVVVHLFARAYRDYYDLELLWGDAPKLTWVRSESA